jgi:ADP-ribosylglycohydrolase
MGAITGAIAEAYYKEIPEHIVTEVLKRLPGEFKEVMEKLYEKFIHLGNVE